MGPWHERRSQAGRPDAEVLPASQRDPASVATTRLRRRGQPGRAAVAPCCPRGAAPALVAADPQGPGAGGGAVRRCQPAGAGRRAAAHGKPGRSWRRTALLWPEAASQHRGRGSTGAAGGIRRGGLGFRAKPRRCIPDCRTRATGAWTRCCAPLRAWAQRAGLPSRGPATLRRVELKMPRVRRRSAAVARAALELELRIIEKMDPEWLSSFPQIR